MLKQTLRSFALGSAVILGMTASVLAQSTTNGGIHGTVLDPSGALVPQAQVTISNATGFSRTLKSDATGAFMAAELAPGSYSITIDATGFTPALEGDVQVASHMVTLEKIRIGISVAQEIEVSASDDVSAQNR